MDTQKAFLVIGLTLIIVILFNIAILSISKKERSNTYKQVKLLSKMFNHARNPWSEDNAKLAELSKLMDEINKINETEKPEEIN